MTKKLLMNFLTKVNTFDRQSQSLHVFFHWRVTFLYVFSTRNLSGECFTVYLPSTDHGHLLSCRCQWRSQQYLVYWNSQFSPACESKTKTTTKHELVRTMSIRKLTNVFLVKKSKTKVKYVQKKKSV